MGYLAGAIHEVLDDLLTVGSYPWTKTVNGTNDVTYQAPGGSEMMLHVAQNYSLSTNLLIQLYAQVGTDPEFPTPTQVVTAGQGYVTLRPRDSTSSATTYDSNWYGIRTDRFMLLAIGPNNAGSVMGSIVAAGDFPVLSGSDPGLTCILGSTSTTSSNTSTSTEYTLTGALYPPQSSPPNGVYGYSYNHFQGSTLSHPVFCWQTLPNNSYLYYSDTLGELQLGKLLIGTSANTTDASNISTRTMYRGYVPYLRSCPVRQADMANEDTFTDAGGATYMYWDSLNNYPAVLMISDDEALP